MAYELFGSLLPNLPDSYLLEQLGHRTAGAWAKESLKLWQRQVVTALELLERVPASYFGKLAELISLTIGSYYGPQKAAYFRSKDVQEKEKEEEPEIRFTAIFTQYLHDFENLYRHIASIYAFAKDALFGGMHAGRPANWYLEQSAKTKVGKLDSPVSLSSGPVAGLIRGYDRHFRNSIAHSFFRFIGCGTVEMWDKNEKGKETWRSTLTFEDCEAKLETLNLTISALEAAYFLFVMRHRSQLFSAAPMPRPPLMSVQERNDAIFITAQSYYQLEIVDINQNVSALSVRAKIIRNFDIPQTESFYVGGPSGASAYDVELTVFEVELPKVVFGFVRNIFPLLAGIEELSVNIVDHDGKDSGRLVLSKEQLEYMAKADDKKMPLESIPTKENTLSQIRMKFSHRGRPYPKKPAQTRIFAPPPKKIFIP